MSADETILLRVERKRPVAAGVTEFTFVSGVGGQLPAWRPGAHVALHLPTGVERQYSLCGDPDDRERWTIAVKLEDESRGGSSYLTYSLDEGDHVEADGPHHQFEYAGESRVLFIAGGIGITPIRPMARQAWRHGADWRLLYVGKDREGMAYEAELSAHERVTCHRSREGGRVDLGAVLAGLEPDVAVYACGPEGMLEELARLTEGWPEGRYHAERFTPLAVDTSADVVFEVELESTGEVLEVPPGRSILSVVEDAGAFVLSSCQEGTCGTCETVVLEGEVDHRDVVLSPAEQAENSRMMICVSRAARGCPRLRLDL